jgi:hypothetical protein
MALPVPGLDERSHPVAQVAIEEPPRGPTPQAVDQTADPLGLIAGLEAAELPEADPESVGALGIGDLTK